MVGLWGVHLNAVVVVVVTYVNVRSASAIVVVVLDSVLGV